MADTNAPMPETVQVTTDESSGETVDVPTTFTHDDLAGTVGDGDVPAEIQVDRIRVQNGGVVAVMDVPITDIQPNRTHVTIEVTYISQVHLSDAPSVDRAGWWATTVTHSLQQLGERVWTRERDE